jgi:hypothetical protein
MTLVIQGLAWDRHNKDHDMTLVILAYQRHIMVFVVSVPDPGLPTSYHGLCCVCPKPWITNVISWSLLCLSQALDYQRHIMVFVVLREVS